MASNGGSDPVQARFAAIDWGAVGPSLVPGMGCMAVSVSMSHDGENFSVNYGFGQANPGSPGALWQPAPGGSPAGAVLAIDFDSSGYDSSEDAMHLRSIDGSLDYKLTGYLVTGTDDSIAFQLEALAVNSANLHEMGVVVQSETSNVVQFAAAARYMVTYDVGTGFTATLASQSGQDSSQPMLDDQLISRMPPDQSEEMAGMTGETIMGTITNMAGFFNQLLNAR